MQRPLAAVVLFAISLISAALAAQQPGIKDYGVRDYVRIGRDLPHREDAPWQLICALPYNCHFQPWIEVESTGGQQITFESTNPLVLYLTKAETWTTKGGVEQYEATAWVSGEGARYTIPAGVTVRAVRYRETGYDTTFAGSFTCSDDDFTVLWQKAARTAYLCMRDHFYDCPDRERVGFWGDGTPELGSCFYCFDDKSHRLCRELVLRKLEPKFYPGQHLEFLGSYGLWFYWLQTGDLDAMRAVYAPTKTFLFDTYKTGNAHTWFDWGKEVKDIAVVETCFLYDCLGTLLKIARLTGHDDDAPAIAAKLAAIRADFDARFWNGTAYQSAQVAVPDDRANAMAVAVGLAARDKWPAILRVLDTTTHASCFFDRWVFEALCAMGEPARALQRMRTRYRTMIPCTFTTLWEHYDRWWASHIDAFDDASSLNHGWNPPALVLSQTVAGVGPDEPGWRTFHVLPQEAFLASLHVVVPTLRGAVTVDVQKSERDYALTVTVPDGTTANVGMPKRPFAKLEAIALGDAVVWAGAWRGGPSGIAWRGEDDDYITFTLAPGTWTLHGRGAIDVAARAAPNVHPAREEPLDPKGWTARASVPDGSFLFSGDKIPVAVPAAAAIDGDHWTGWRDMTQLQQPGQWLQIDMQRPQRIGKVVLDNTWALWDSPTGYTLAASDDGEQWREIASGKGELGITTIAFAPQTARHLRVTQTGTSGTYHWSVYELEVFAAR